MWNPGIPPPGTTCQSIMLRALLLASGSNRNDTLEYFVPQMAKGNWRVTAVGTTAFQTI
jgi:hypothetical protein